MIENPIRGEEVIVPSFGVGRIIRLPGDIALDRHQTHVPAGYIRVKPYAADYEMDFAIENVTRHIPEPLKLVMHALRSLLAEQRGLGGAYHALTREVDLHTTALRQS